MLVEVIGATFGYGRRPVVRVDALALHAGRCLGVIGPNGAGKTTLVRGLTGLLKPMAYIVLKPGKTAGNGLQETLKEHVKAKAGAWKYPRWIELVDSLPKTATGKIQRFKLREAR